MKIEIPLLSIILAASLALYYRWRLKAGLSVPGVSRDNKWVRPTNVSIRIVAIALLKIAAPLVVCFVAYVSLKIDLVREQLPSLVVLLCLIWLVQAAMIFRNFTWGLAGKIVIFATGIALPAIVVSAYMEEGTIGDPALMIVTASLNSFYYTLAGLLNRQSLPP